MRPLHQLWPVEGISNLLQPYVQETRNYGFLSCIWTFEVLDLHHADARKQHADVERVLTKTY